MVVFRVRCLAVVFAALAGSVVAGQASEQPLEGSVPRVVRFDGVWTPDGGQAAASAETVTLAIYDAASGGAPLWEETQIVSVDATGHYAVLVGASRPEGLSPDLLASNAPRWLEVRFARSAVAAPRVLLTSVPYALRASNADTLGGLPVEAFLRATPRAAGGDTATDGDTPEVRTPAPAVNTGTANYIGKFTNAVDLTSSVMFENGGRIGVGTTAPLDTVHARFTDAGGGVTGYAVQNLSSAANAYSGMLFYDHLGNLGQFQGFNNSTKEYRINNIAPGGSINFMISGASRFLVRNDGDIQISGNMRKGADLWMHELGGGQNTALGRQALSVVNLGGGSTNTAIGFQSMQAATGGGGNVAIGRGTLRQLTNGQQNVAIGYDALRAVDTSYNIAIGAFAGADKVSGSRNIYIGQGVGSFFGNSESDTIRIGDFSGQYSRFFAGGIRAVTTGLSDAVPVMIDSTGQLGTTNSSRRYKDDIQDMGEASSGLMKLRPVTYRYTQAYADGSRPIDYGLIAEEVEQVYPDLVAHLANGEVETVQYHKINAMLLNEVQKQHRQIQGLTERLAVLERLLTTTPK